MTAPVLTDSPPLPIKIKRRLRYYCIKKPQDAFWIEEAQVNGVKFDQLTVDLSNWFIRGYEVKVGRGDFLQDRKWQNYLPYVNQFWFCTPPALVGPSEIPDGIGLLEYHDDTGSLTIMKKARVLQPVFLQRDLGSEFVIRLMKSFIRDVSWRASNAYVRCECGKSVNVGDARGVMGQYVSL